MSEHDVPRTAEKDTPRHGPDLSTQGLPTCLCGRTFWTWRAQGIHETQANKRVVPPAVQQDGAP